MMKVKYILVIFSLIIFFIIQTTGLANFTTQKDKYYFNDTFINLNNWEKFQFSADKKTTKFTILNNDLRNVLQLKSDSSASGLICKKRFNPLQYSVLQWRWKVSNIIPKINGTKKEEDDYAIRIFVLFDKDSSQKTFWEKLQNKVIKLLSGYEPPYKSLCYVWANSDTLQSPYVSPYSDDVMIIPIKTGSEKCNQWFEEQVNFGKDYKKYFKENAPAIATIAISGDTDNTLYSTQSLLDYIKIR